MLQYLWRRLLALLPTALVPIIFIFFLVRLAPGDPARNILGDYATEEDVTKLRHELGLDASVLMQFWEFITGALRGDLGTSYYMFMPVREVIPPYAAVTLQIGAMSMIVALVLGVIVGLGAAFGRNRWYGRLANLYSVAGISVPSFFVAILLIVIFGVRLGWFEVGMYVPMQDGVLEHFRSLTLPALALGIGEAAFIGRVVRGALLDVMAEPFVTTARSLGVPDGRIIRVHVMRLVALQVVTVMGLFAATLVSGSVIMENIYGIPGMGSLLLNAVTGRDYYLIQGIVILTGMFIIMFNLIVDLLYALIDPRVQFGKVAS